VSRLGEWVGLEYKTTKMVSAKVLCAMGGARNIIQYKIQPSNRAAILLPTFMRL